MVELEAQGTEDRRLPVAGDRQARPPSRPWPWSILAASLGVVLWRLVTFVQLGSGRTEEALQDPVGLMWLRGVMGLLFVAAGLMVVRHHARWTRPFAWYAVTYGLHWGGPVLLGAEQPARTLVFFFYLLISGALAHSYLLLWLYSFPSRRIPLWLRSVVMVPPGVALLAGAAGLLRGWSAWTGIAQAVLAIWPTLATLLGLLALSVAALRHAQTRRRQLLLIALLLAAFVPYEVASLLGEEALAAWLTLLFAALPVAMVVWARQDASVEPAARAIDPDVS